MTTTGPGTPVEGPDRPAPTAGTAARRAARQQQGTTPGGRGSAGPGPRGADRRREENRARRGLDPDTLAALEEERDFLLTSLADLEREHDAGDVDDTDYDELKDDYTARTAAVLRALDERRALAEQVRRPRSWGRIAAGVLVVVLLAGLGGWLVARASGSRAPGGQATGDVRQSSRDLLLEAQQYTGQATQALNEGRTDAALENYTSAIETYRKVLQIQPANAEALTYQGWVLHSVALASDSAAAGQLDAQALQLLDEAVASDPTYADARVFRAILHRNAGRTDAARADLAAITDADVPSFMRQMVDGLRQELATGTTGSSTPAASTPSG